jgi:hypothetical protein
MMECEHADDIERPFYVAADNDDTTGTIVIIKVVDPWSPVGHSVLELTLDEVRAVVRAYDRYRYHHMRSKSKVRP